jgi:hypothetical protein
MDRFRLDRVSNTLFIPNEIINGSSKLISNKRDWKMNSVHIQNRLKSGGNGLTTWIRTTVIHPATSFCPLFELGRITT